MYGRIIVCTMVILPVCSCMALEKKTWRTSEDAIVKRAVGVYASGKMTESEVLNKYAPAVVYLPNMTCVGLNLKSGWAGGDTTICFDRNGKQVLRYLSGE